jgi:16S rRNA (guanine(966)-N(2))-methyltransferase RsmD
MSIFLPCTKEGFTLRVISGTLRGLKLKSLPGTDTRPTLDRVKEALFSMLMSSVADSVGLDLFAGSGALGIELMSRYGGVCTFLDSSAEACKVIKDNLTKARLTDGVSVERKDAISFISETSKKFDIIFLDPPYMSELYDKALSIIKERQLLRSNGLVVCECLAGYTPDCTGYIITKDKTYGKVRLLILEEA